MSGASEDQPARRFGARDAGRLDPGGRRRGDRPGPGQGGAGGARSMASCATSIARSTAMPSWRWSPRATRPRRSSSRVTTMPMSSPRRCRRCGPARRSPSARRPTTASITTSRPPTARDPFTEDDLPAIEEKMREIIAADKPLRREVWSRQQLIDRWQAEGETFKAEWAQELPEGEELTVYWSGDDWLDMCRGPHLASHRQARPAGLQADARRRAPTGAATRRTRSSAASTAPAGSTRSSSTRTSTGWRKRPSATTASSAARWTCSTCRKKRMARSSGTRRAISSGASSKPTCAARSTAPAISEVKTPQVMDARQWEQSGHWGKYRENMFVIPDEVPNIEDEGPLVSDEADWMALKPMNCPAHVLIFQPGHQELPRPAAAHLRERLLPPQRAARRAARADARAPVHAGRRAYLLPRGPDRRRGAQVLRAGRRDLQGLRLHATRSSSRCAPSSASAPTQTGTRPRPNCARRWPTPAWPTTNTAGKSCPAKARSTHPSSNGT